MLVALIIVVAAAVLLGVAVVRLIDRQRAHDARARQVAAELEHQLEAQRAEADERGRIAAELHDVIATELDQLARSDDERTRRLALDARGELGRLRAVLSVGEDPAPPNALDHLPALVERVRADGLPVTLLVEGERRLAPPSLEATAYRVVQDALAHALREDGDAPTSVRVVWRRSLLGVRVRVAGRIAEHGLDTLALEQRVALYDGELRIGPHGRAFEVTATLPLP